MNVSILDGGIPKWLSNGYPTVSGPPPVYPATTYTPTFHPELVRDYEQMMENRTTNNEQVFSSVHVVECRCIVLPRAHILPLRRRGHANLDDQNSNRVTKNSNKLVRIVTCIHTYVRIVGRLPNIVYCLYI